jgi:hypothetical protein
MESTNQKGKQKEEKMNTLIAILLYLSCHGGTTGVCYTEELKLTREAVAVATCESGNTVDYGTMSWEARSNKQNSDGTFDYGAFQFNENTYLWLTDRSNAAVDHPTIQYQQFLRLWNNGKGWKHWKASQPCWSQWLTINDEGRAVWR